MPVLCLIARPVPYLETIKYFTVKSIFRCLIERPPLAGCCRRRYQTPVREEIEDI